MSGATALHRRHDYRRFNQSYFDLILRLEAWQLTAAHDTAPIQLGPFPRSTANTAKTDLYRFRTFLCNADPTDEYAQRLYAVFNNFTICMEPVDPDDRKGAHYLAFRVNPISLAMGALTNE